MYVNKDNYKHKLHEAFRTLQLDSDLSFGVKNFEENLICVSPAYKKNAGYYSSDEFFKNKNLLGSLDLSNWKYHYNENTKIIFQKIEFRIKRITDSVENSLQSFARDKKQKSKPPLMKLKYILMMNVFIQLYLIKQKSIQTEKNVLSYL
ncbi:MAG: hypothetical protein PF445_09685 [Melioribacteraceae bacterium]|jgi:hypothetical protein|nr:hypothetical protein [Melioribacteraceae bacterium]